jgi:Epoxide hydrolase N terminus
MTRTVENAAEIRSFRVDMPNEAIAGLRRRIAATRLPSKELVDDRSQGVQLATMEELARYWAADDDWRARATLLPGRSPGCSRPRSGQRSGRCDSTSRPRCASTRSRQTESGAAHQRITGLGMRIQSNPAGPRLWSTRFHSANVRQVL